MRKRANEAAFWPRFRPRALPPNSSADTCYACRTWAVQHTSPAHFLSKVNPNETLENPSTVASLIDHTLLKAEASASGIAQLCAEAREYVFASVCVNPCWVRLAAETLAGSKVKVCSVIGFPLGANETETKLFEVELALECGAGELDVVQNIGALLSGNEAQVVKELTALARLAHRRDALLKVILETCLLTEPQKQRACALAVEAGADFVKTSTGFSKSGATAEDVRLMRRCVGNAAAVKASGGIRTLASLREMVDAGASRIGTSAGVSIIDELRSNAGSAAAPAAHEASY